MTKSKKITLSASRDIPFNKLVLSQANVRHIKAGVSIEELAEDIARRTLLASLTVRPVLNEDGAETGMFEVPAGGRRFRALELLVKKRRLNRTAPVPCIVRTEGLAEEDSLAENIQRAPLHPLDQFRAFQAMREKGKSEEEIAAAFFVSVNVVKQRLKLAAVSDTLLEAYADDEMTLDQLMAFTVNPDHERQEQVWEALEQHYNKQPYEIRRMLTEGAVRASDRRAQFVGLDNYVEAGGDAPAAPNSGDVTDDDSSDAQQVDEDEDDDGTKPLSDRLICELTVHRTMALRDALAGDPQLAMLACLHAMVLQLFYHYGQDSCVEITPRSTQFGSQAPNLGDARYVQSIDLGIETWAGNLPKEPEDLWDALAEWDSDSRDALFAHCVAMTVNAVQEPHYRKPRQIAHADVLASTLGLDMVKAGWAPTADNYLGRVTKAQILAAVREAKGDKDADRIAGFKKPEMVDAAEELLAGTGWLPAPLRTPALVEEPDEPEFEIVDEGDVERVEEGEAKSAAEDGETVVGDVEPIDNDEQVAAFA